MNLKYTLIFFLLGLQSIGLAQNWDASKVSDRLQAAIQESPNDYHDVSFLLSDRADIQSLDVQFRQQNADRGTRAHAVITALQQKAQQTQPPILAILNQSEKVQVNSIRPYWVVNIIYAKVQKELIETLSMDSRIAMIDLNAILELDEYQNEEAIENAMMPVIPNGIEPGLAAINAPAMWALGYRGYGAKVLSIDTGVDPTHPALASQYYGNVVGDDLAWYDYNNPNSPPNDCGDHGTHTIGTMVGLDKTTNDTIGVAFQAQFMAAQAICGFGSADNLASFQWAIDPDGDPATFNDMPDVINNSWQDPSVSATQCLTTNNPYRDLFIALETAGIAVVFSAGNGGPDSLTITPPKNINLDTVNVFCVAAVNGNFPSFPIAGFSSRGPSQCGGTGTLLIKPEVAAPGQSVRSCEPNNTYGNKSGTSMAAPHVAGALLLLRQAFPNLHARDLKLALFHTAVDLGDPGEDNTFGNGIIDVFAAYNYLISLGNQPAPPYANNDLALEGVSNINDIVCDTEFSPILNAYNQGTDTIYNAVVQLIYEDGTVDSVAWSGVALPFEAFDIPFSTQMPGTGYYRLRFEVVSVNGIADERNENDFLNKSFLLTDIQPVEGVDGTACVNAEILLQANTPINGEIRWYNSPTLQTPIGTGSSYLADPIDNDSTDVVYYADVIQQDSLGMPDNSNGGGGFINDLNAGLKFNALAPFTLKSVTVYTDVIGGRRIEVVNSAGTVIRSKVVGLASVGEHKLDLNFQIPAGQEYEIRPSIRAEYYFSAGGAYPYIIPEIVEITGANQGNAYYYFYNWEIEYGSPCGRTPVMASADTGTHVTDFLVLGDTINQFAITDIPFTDNTVGATSWLWNFGDGTTSTDQNPTHHYNESGLYNVILSTTGVDGCSDAHQQTILVENAFPVNTENTLDDFGSINIYPNPSQGDFIIDFDLSSSQLIQGQVFDLLGRQMLQLSKQNIQSEQIHLNTNNLEKGLYLLQLKVGSKTIVRKLMKL